MPPRAKITKEMIAEAAFEVPRAEGAGKINARRVSQKLGCSTQPVMYHFKTMGELEKAACERADLYRGAYISDIHTGEQAVSAHMEHVFAGALYALRRGRNEPSVSDVSEK